MAVHVKIDKHIYEEAIRKQLPDETVKVLEITNRCLTSKGLNFLSDLYVTSIKYMIISNNKKEEAKSERLMNVVVKFEPQHKVPLDLVRQQNLFLVELKVLRDILPRIKELIPRQLGPNLLYGSDNPRILIMENLIDRGFIMKHRQKGLSLEHCCLAMEQVARIHAGSVAVFEKDPSLIEFFKHGGIVSAKCPASFLRLIEVSLLRIGNAIKKWSDEKCVSAGNKLIKLSQTIVDRCIDVYNYDEDEFCVLNHGDCWIHNIMVKENEKGYPTDLLMVDYQFSVYTSPVIDLLYFLNICPEYSVKYDKDDYLLKVYLNTLEETMKRIGCKRKPPTMKELKEAIHKRRIYAVFSGVVLYLRMMANAEDVEDFIEVLGNLSGDTQMDVFKNLDAVKLAQKMIPIMNERGYFD